MRGPPATARNARRLGAVKLLHSVVWAFFAACTLAMPVCALAGAQAAAVWLAAIVGVEVIVLVANARRCPLTAIAARYTDDRAANFDIFLPVWLARHNQVLFGSLYLAGLVVVLVCWLLGR